tara:strand:+ start:60 stop:839 length:780 start_codon:yes stop_codon:yes gene_type:complete
LGKINNGIGFFGCSFTEGGGLDSEEWNEYGIKHNLISSKYNVEGLEPGPLNFDQRLNMYTQYRDEKKFSTLVGKELGCNVVNYALSGNSNENIINQLYENIDKFDVFVVQFTIYTRRYYWLESVNKFYNINGVDFENNPLLTDKILGAPPREYTEQLIETYKNYIAYHYNKDYEMKKYCRYVDLFENLGKEIYWIFYDPTPKVEELSDNVLYWNLRDYALDNELEMIHQTKGVYKDRHLSLKGNEVVANKIVEKISENR